MRRHRVDVVADERGVALIMAVGVMMVVTLILVTVLTFTSANARSTHYANADAKAFALAEAGLSDALARLNYVAINENPYVTTSVGTGSRTLNGGTASFTGSLTGLTWTLTGTGSVASPYPGGAPVTRSVTKEVLVTVQNTPWAWNYADAATGCLTLNNNAIFAAPLFTRGNLCLSNGAVFTGARLHVGGTVNGNTTGSVGTSSAPIESANIVGGCLPGPHPCNASDRVYALSRTSNPSPLTKPAVDLAGWYQRAKPGPNQPCTAGIGIPGGFDNDTTLNRSRATFDLTPATPYDCRVYDGSGNLVGRLSWTPGFPGTLLVDGTIFIDGDIRHTGSAVYSGRATIYSSGTVTMTNSSLLCGVATCDNSWDPSANLLLLVAGSSTDTVGLLIDNNGVYQGAAYTVNDYFLDNNAQNWGPVIARQFTIDNNAGLTKPLAFLPPGAPGIEETFQPVAGSWSG
ncbi:MAG: hypothetical protein M3310_01410 [Actinomycetota bacterium]|nr:hypothetical protein [Actinomycetota bacterium]